MALIKGAITVMVVIGLYLAAIASIEQWQTESAKVESRLVEIDRELTSSLSSQQEHQLLEERQRLERSLPTLQNLNWSLIALAGLLYGIGLVPNGLLLHRALHALGQRPRLSTTVAAHLLGHVGKYVPGKAMVIVLRAGTLSRDGVKPLAATIAVFLETFLMMAVGAAVAGLIVVWLPVPMWISWMAVGMAVVASLPTLPPVMRIAAARVTKARDVRDDARIGFGLFAAGWGYSILTWALIGGSFATLMVAIPTSSPLPSLPVVYAIGTAAISLAVVLGFASLIPGGAGIRELVLTTILAVSFGPAHGLLAAIAARILYLLVEALIAGACWCWLRSSNP